MLKNGLFSIYIYARIDAEDAEDAEDSDEETDGEYAGFYISQFAIANPPPPAIAIYRH